MQDNQVQQPQEPKELNIEEVKPLLEKQGFYVFNDEQLNSRISESFGTTMGGIDSFIAEKTGIEKPNGLKTTEFVKTGFQHYEQMIEQQKSQFEELQSKYSELEKSKSSDEGLTKSLTETKSILEQVQAEYEKYKADTQSKFEAMQFDNEINRELSNFKFRADLDESIRNEFLNSKRARIAQMKREKRGETMAFLGENGQALYKGAELQTLKDVLASELDPIIDKGTSFGTQGQVQVKIENGKVSLPPNIKNQVQLRDVLKKQGKSQDEITLALKDAEKQGLPLM